MNSDGNDFGMYPEDSLLAFGVNTLAERCVWLQLVGVLITLDRIFHTITRSSRAGCKNYNSAGLLRLIWRSRRGGEALSLTSGWKPSGTQVTHYK